MRRIMACSKRRTLAIGVAAVGVALVVALAPAGASAFGVSSFNFSPSTTQAAGHPDVHVSINFSTGPGEDVRDLTLDFPPGLIGNPEKKSKCSQSRFQLDFCSPGSSVGGASVVASAL